MAELSTIARPYAEALFAAAGAKPADAGLAGQWAPALIALAGYAGDPDVAVALGNPQLSDERRFALLAGLYGKALPAPVAQLLSVVIENGRMAALPEIASQFHALQNSAEGVADCVIESAFAMDAGAVNTLVAALARKFPLKLVAEVRVNPQLIGGVRVTVGDRVLDGSVRARLDAMQARLTA